MVHDQPISRSGMHVVIERLPAAEGGKGVPEAAQDPADAHERCAVVIVEVLPVNITPEVNAGVPTWRQDVVLGELLSLPQHRRTLTGVEGDDEGLDLEEFAAIRQGRIARLRPDERDEVAVIVGV